MTTLDASNNGVVYNSTSDALSNATAIVDLLETDSSTGDTINFDANPGDIVWVDTNDADLARVIDLQGSNIPSNITVTAPTDGNGEPGVTIKSVNDLSVGHYMIELSVQDNMILDIENIEFDGNDRNNGNNAVPFIARDGDGSSITFNNCKFRNGGDVSFRELDGSGIRFEYCTFIGSTNQHGCAVTHRSLSTANFTEFYRCHFTDNGIGGTGGGYGLNQSPGKTRVTECVIEGNKRGVKWGTDPDYVGNFGVEYKDVRIADNNDEGIFILADNTLHDVTHSVRNVIIENSGDYGILTGGSADDDSEINVETDSKLIVKNSTDNNIDLRGNSTISTSSGAEIQSCGSSGDGIRYDSGKDSTIDLLNTSGNVADVNDTASTGVLTINTQTTDSCASDLASVPTVSEVGVGAETTQSTTVAAARASGTGMRVLSSGLVTSLPAPLDTVTMIDSYEDGDLAEYTGDTGSFNVVDEGSLSFSAIDGSNVLEIPSGNTTIDIYSTSGLDNYFSKGDTGHVYFRPDQIIDDCEILFGAADADNNYHVQFGDDFIRIRKNVAGSRTNLASTFSFGWAADTWHRLEITWDDGTLGGIDGDITVDVYKNVTGPDDGTLVDSISVNDTESGLQGNLGIGFYKGGGTTATFYFDFWNLP